MRQLCQGSEKGLRPAQYDKVDRVHIFDKCDDHHCGYNDHNDGGDDHNDGDNDHNDGGDDHNDGDNDHNDGGGLQDTKCELLLMSDPYLRLGPFLLEHKNKAGNYIAQVGKVKMYNVRNIFLQKLYKLAHFY